ncbi:MAG: ArsB/NhaD family transporter [Lentisphaerales bacterium]|nr:ArsB/NhaD family transporter [Lentisphaerales bacterium]
MFWAGTAIFVVTYIAIASEKVHKTSAALAGAMLMLFFILPGPHGASGEGPILDSFARYVNFDVIFTLAGMMVLVNVLSETGLFQYVAIKSAKVAKGSPVYTLILLVFSTAVLSAFLDNVTTILLIVPVTLVVTAELEVPPIPFLMAETIASNIGGTATLIGDPPNLIIGSQAGLSFGAFMVNLAPFILILLILYCLFLWVYYKNEMQVTVEKRARIMEFDEKSSIVEPVMLKKAGFIMCLTLLGFLAHGALHLEPSVIAMSGATAALLFCCKDIDHALEKIEWSTLFFFIGLFLLVKGAEHAGLMEELGSLLNLISDWHPLAIIITLIWVCGLCAGIMNNVSFTAAIVIIIQAFMARHGAFVDSPAMQETLWWALALAVCLGGNLTAVGAAANLCTISIAKKGGQDISFKTFSMYSLPITIVTLILTSVYVAIRYWVLI